MASGKFNGNIVSLFGRFVSSGGAFTDDSNVSAPRTVEPSHRRSNTPTFPTWMLWTGLPWKW
jgi:hypothetical protein